MLQGFVNVPLEMALGTSSAPVDVQVSGEGGSWVLPAYLVSDGTCRARFAAPLPGRYTYSASTGAQGEITVAPYAGENPLYRHGRLRVAATRRSLEHADGTPFFWLADTWWMGLTTRLDWPRGFHSLVADRVIKGFNAVQMVAGPLPDFDAVTGAWNPQQQNEGGFSWKENWAALNPAYYDDADRRIAALVDAGLLPIIVGMWGYYLPFMGRERAMAHWRNLVARYAAYPVAWCIAGEVNMPTYSLFADQQKAAAARNEQEAGWTEVARMVRHLDPYRNPLTAHPSHPDSRAMLHDESLLDLDLLQTGHGGYQSLGPTVETVQACLAKTPPMPVINSEVCYEGIMGGSWHEVQRFLFWTCLTLGCAGHTYGAQGIWAMNSREERFYGTTPNWGDGFWQDVMHLPGSMHVGMGRQFVLRYPWWKLTPREEPALPEGRLSAFSCGIPGALSIIYLPVGCVANELRGMHNSWATDVAEIALEPGAYRACYLNPRTLEELPIGAAVPGCTGRWTPPPKPSMEDWVLVVENPDALPR
ncbi:MAG: putative endoglucanase [bacterium ADurb.Bin429]|nr:MAG: putative endoglucanase [bacterium ADurb.Bin429]